MADDKPTLDPSAQFQEYVTQWERSVDQFFNQLMGNEQFSQSMNQMQGLQIEFQKNFRDSMANQLTSMNMPSRDDILQIGEDIRVLDARLGRMEDKLNQLLGNEGSSGTSKKSGPPRTKQPPEKKEQ